MSVSIKTGSANLICDGIDKGAVEFSVAIPDDGADLTKRGKFWGSKDAISDAMNASAVGLKSHEGHTYPVSVEELDRDGAALFTVLAAAE
ncbi:hypothetical protein F9K85_12595 [Brucella tritici]|uniref:Uncharacterized protein n=1 Tax=Brucella tritici TaxID=94626 RepID=A0A6N6QIG9_9HYPH|nr:hypothetical protein [Brucella tritici]KAB2665651.1 hypothetical protein F9K91_08325 [Brucella tritici]KAB2676025.1 hypothetical protein F9K85_12595 [Brucella tritici]KAB2682346.1 hypothetical protein F9L08_17820 [Brucella tritici]NKW09028.1 hypothetical protein [Brucella tritici]